MTVKTVKFYYAVCSDQKVENIKAAIQEAIPNAQSFQLFESLAKAHQKVQTEKKQNCSGSWKYPLLQIASSSSASYSSSSSAAATRKKSVKTSGC